MNASVEERLYTIRYKTAKTSHLIVRNQDVCANCPTKDCTFFCPADVYQWDENKQLTAVAFENCIECGTCRLGCPERNIEWLLPTGGYGISYKFG